MFANPWPGATLAFDSWGATGGHRTTGPERVGVGTAGAPRSSSAVKKYEKVPGHALNTWNTE